METAHQSKVTAKDVYGGMFVDKYFLEVDGVMFQVPYETWKQYKKGDSIDIHVVKNDKA